MVVSEPSLKSQRTHFYTTLCLKQYVSSFRSIHSYAQILQEKASAVFVRKRIRAQRQVDGVAGVEFDCLTALRLLRHPNIVPLLYCFTQDQHLNFIFPCLEIDLAAFLNRDERFGRFTDDLTFYQAVQGLTSALHSVHSFRIQGEVNIDLLMMHHDLRPANILVGHDTFFLADFGLSRIKSRGQESKTEWKDTMGDYIAPECMNENFKTQRVGRATDIWALGCLLIELATYILTGADGVRIAREERMCLASEEWRLLNSYFWLGDGIRLQVHQQIATLRALGNSGVNGLLNIATTLLQVDTADRPTAEIAQNMTSCLTTQQLCLLADKTLSSFELYLRESECSTSLALDVWIELRKLRSWASTVNFEVENYHDTHTANHASEHIAKQSQKILYELCALYGNFKEQTHDAIVRGEESSTMKSKTLYRVTCDEIRKCIQKLYDMLSISQRRFVGLMCERQIIHGADTQGLGITQINDLGSSQNQELAAMALLKSLKQSLETINHSNSRARSLGLERSQLRDWNTITDGHHEIAWLHESSANDDSTSSPRRVLIERVEYSISWLQRTPEERAERIVALASLLSRKQPARLRVLNCSGYLTLNREGYALIFDFPTNPENATPETLLGRLKQAESKPKSRQVPTKPALEVRCQLALLLARSVSELHSINWLHKALNSNNILFFSDPLRFGNPDLLKPYVVGFRFSRPNGISNFSDGRSQIDEYVDYVHPQYLVDNKRLVDTWTGMDDENIGRFRQRYDYYSLGIILIELAYWAPIKHILKFHDKENPQQIQQTLLEKYIPRLGGVIGGLYMKAVRACIDDSIIESDDTALGTEPGHFHVTVVEPLTRICV